MKIGMGKIILWFYSIAGAIATLNWFLKWAEVDHNQEMDYIRAGLFAGILLEILERLEKNEKNRI